MDVESASLLLVDDCVPVRRTLRGLLLHLGFRNIDESGDAESALAKMRERPYSLVISDLAMGEKSGLDLLRDMRADEGLKDTPFLMVTGYAAPDDVMSAKEAGVDGYIVKPFNTTTLRQKVWAVLGAA